MSGYLSSVLQNIKHAFQKISAFAERHFLVILVAFHAAYAAVALIYHGHFTPDSEDYLWQAGNLWDKGRTYSKDFLEPFHPDYVTKRPPLYAMLLAPFIQFRAGWWIFLLLQNIISITGLMWLRSMAINNGFGGIASLAVLGGLLLFPNFLIYPQMYMSETMLAFLLIAYLRSWQIWLEGDKRQIFFKALILTAAVFTKPVMLWFWLPDALLTLWLFKKTETPRSAIFALLIFPIMVNIWEYRNQKVTGYRHFSSISVVNLRDYNLRYYQAWQHGQEYADSINIQIKERALTLADYATAQKFTADTCKTLLFRNTWQYGLFHARGMIFFLADPGRFDFYHWTNREEPEKGMLQQLSDSRNAGLVELIHAFPPVFWLFILLTGGGFLVLMVGTFFSIVCLRRLPVIWLIALIIGVYVMILTGPIGSARFRMPVQMLLWMPAIWGLLNFKWWQSPLTQWQSGLEDN